MYAMLTGSLPFNVDPFNIKTLYNKMMSGQMNPLPEGLSRGMSQNSATASRRCTVDVRPDEPVSRSFRLRLERTRSALKKRVEPCICN